MRSSLIAPISSLLVLLTACDGDRPSPSQMIQGNTEASSSNWLNGYSTVVLQRPSNDFAHTFQLVGERIRSYKFEVLTPEAWPTLSADYKRKTLVFTYAYGFEGGAWLFGTFTDATTGQVVRQWRSSSRGEATHMACLISCVDDGMGFFRDRKGYDPTETEDRPLPWQH